MLRLEVKNALKKSSIFVKRIKNKKKMKKLLAITLFSVLATLGYSQKALPLVSFASGDTVAIVMESDVYKVTPQTGDTTSEVKYFYREQRKSVIVSTEDSLFSTYGSRLLEGAGFGFVINVDNINGVVRLTDSTCTVFYNEGRLEKRYELSISAGDFQALINGL